MVEIGEKNGKECVVCKRPLTGKRRTLCGDAACDREKARRNSAKHREKKGAPIGKRKILKCVAPDCSNILTGKQKKFCGANCKYTVQMLIAIEREKAGRIRSQIPTSRRALMRINARKCSICGILITDTPRLQDKGVTTAVSRNGKDLCIGCASGDGLLNALLTTERVLFVKSPERTRGRARFK